MFAANLASLALAGRLINPLLAWRFASHSQRVKLASGGKACGSLACRGLSAASLSKQKSTN